MKREMATTSPVTLEFLAARVAAVTDNMADLKLRVSGLETRFGVLEARIGGIERRLDLLDDRTSRILSIVVRIAERVGAPGEPQP
jgi:hypothetical protein